MLKILTLVGCAVAFALLADLESVSASPLIAFKPGQTKFSEQEINDMFQQYKIDFNRHYRTRMAEVSALNYFAKAVEAIAIQNRRYLDHESPYALRLSQFSDKDVY